MFSLLWWCLIIYMGYKKNKWNTWYTKWQEIHSVQSPISLYPNLNSHSCGDVVQCTVNTEPLSIWNSVLTTVYHLSPTLFLYIECVCVLCVSCCVSVIVWLFCLFARVCVCVSLLAYLCVLWCLVCLCVQWGEDGCSFSSNRAGWTGWLCQPPRPTRSTSKQRKRNHTRKEVIWKSGSDLLATKKRVAEVVVCHKVVRRYFLM